MCISSIVNREKESVKVLVAKWCLTLCNSMDCDLPDSFVHGILQAKTWSGLRCPHDPRDLPNPGFKPGSPALQADSLLSEPPSKPFLQLLLRSFM